MVGLLQLLQSLENFKLNDSANFMVSSTKCAAIVLFCKRWGMGSEMVKKKRGGKGIYTHSELHPTNTQDIQDGRGPRINHTLTEQVPEGSMPDATFVTCP